MLNFYFEGVPILQLAKEIREFEKHETLPLNGAIRQVLTDRRTGHDYYSVKNLIVDFYRNCAGKWIEHCEKLQGSNNAQTP